MVYKTFTSKLLNPSASKSKSVYLGDIELNIDERCIIAGVVLLKTNDSKPKPAVDALVSLYEGTTAAGSHPVYHTYTDNNGRFVISAKSTPLPYMVKVLYCKVDGQVYKPYSSKPFKTEKGKVHKLICHLEKEDRRVLSGILANRFKEPRSGAEVKLYLTIGLEKIPVVQLASTKPMLPGVLILILPPKAITALL